MFILHEVNLNHVHKLYKVIESIININLDSGLTIHITTMASLEDVALLHQDKNTVARHHHKLCCQPASYRPRRVKNKGALLSPKKSKEQRCFTVTGLELPNHECVSSHEGLFRQ
jgi:hypothetical protein